MRTLSPEQAAAADTVAEAKARGLALTDPDGLLKLFTKKVLETALNEEMTEHLGHEKNQPEPGRESTNVRNGARSNASAGAVKYAIKPICTAPNTATALAALGELEDKWVRSTAP